MAAPDGSNPLGDLFTRAFDLAEDELRVSLDREPDRRRELEALLVIKNQTTLHCRSIERAGGWNGQRT